MNLGVQYYRAPFPESKYWADDFRRIKDAGLDTVQLWVLWGWAESKPGTFRFDDYDQLVDLAATHGLGVVLSTIAAIQPYWIHDQVPGSEMVDNFGRTVISSNRQECHFGLTPGGCTDHPGVWERMKAFLTETARRYRSADHLRGWDVWNELRWNVQADGLVCYCPHTLKAFRDWLRTRFGSIDDLNRAWKRRYNSYDEVRPGKLPGRPYTEMMAFQHFITWRADQHGRARYEVVKAIDPDRPVTLHAATPSPLMAGGDLDHAVNRGNDWFLADHTDSAGCSSFPKWGAMDEADFVFRIQCIRSAAREKAMWLSEIQGGAHATGFEPGTPVDAPAQQRWIYNALATRTDALLFWCWRDEVFGRESSGFGLAGNDGHAEERLAAMRATRRILDAHADLFAAYRPAEPAVGVFFSPQSYYLEWAHEGTARRLRDAVAGYGKALARLSIPFAVVEEAHLDALKGLSVLFLPHAIVVDDATAERLTAFVEGGGTLVCESECGAFTSAGFYRYPEDRFPARLAGAREVGRRALLPQTLTATVEGQSLTLEAAQWLTPLRLDRGDAWSEVAEGALLAQVPVGRGRVILAATYLGEAYRRAWNRDFERFVRLVSHPAGRSADAAVVAPQPDAATFAYLRYGAAGDRRVVFVFMPDGATDVRVRFRPGFFQADTVRDVISGREIALETGPAGRECAVPRGDWGLGILVGRGGRGG